MPLSLPAPRVPLSESGSGHQRWSLWLTSHGEWWSTYEICEITGYPTRLPYCTALGFGEPVMLSRVGGDKSRSPGGSPRRSHPAPSWVPWMSSTHPCPRPGCRCSRRRCCAPSHERGCRSPATPERVADQDSLVGRVLDGELADRRARRSDLDPDPVGRFRGVEHRVALPDEL